MNRHAEIAALRAQLAESIARNQAGGFKNDAHRQLSELEVMLCHHRLREALRELAEGHAHISIETLFDRLHAAGVQISVNTIDDDRGDEAPTHVCTECGWTGTADECRGRSPHFEDPLDYCPNCKGVECIRKTEETSPCL